MTTLYLFLGAVIGAIAAMVIWYYVAHRPLVARYIESLRKVNKLEHQIRFLINRAFGIQKQSKHASKVKCGLDRWN